MNVHAIPIDPHTAAREHTEPLDAVERPPSDAGAHEGPVAPGRWLFVEQGGEQRALPLTRPITHLGRGFGATFQLEDFGVSRRHAILVQRRSSVRILDDRSANGTWVNGRRVSEHELCDGDVIVLGRAVIVYRELAL